MTARDSLRRWSRALFAFAGIAAIYACVTRGIWLDEFWSLRLGDPSLPFATLVEQRWLRDTNPMTANLLYRLAAETGLRDVAGLRLALNLPAAALLLATTLKLDRTSPTRSPFYIVFAILLVALPAFVATFGDFRAYFWQFCAAAVLLQFAYRIIVDAPSIPKPTLLGTALAITALAAALTLHFVGALVASVLVACFLLRFARERNWRLFSAIAVPAALCWSAMLVMFFLQYRRISQDLDTSWIATSTPDALLITGTALSAALIANPAAAALAVLAPRVASDATPGKRAFVMLLATGVAIGAAFLLLVNGWQSVIVDRYLLVWQVAVCAVIAVHAAPAIAAAGWKLYAVIAFSTLSVAVGTYKQSREIGWNGTRDFIASALGDCSETKVYAISPWRLRAQRGSRAAALERPVFEDAYLRLARDAGFGVAIVPDAARILDIPARCPSLLWIEHSGGRRLAGAVEVLRDAGLGFASPARVSMFSTADGVVIVARRGPDG